MERARFCNLAFRVVRVCNCGFLLVIMSVKKKGCQGVRWKVLEQSIVCYSERLPMSCMLEHLFVDGALSDIKRGLFVVAPSKPPPLHS